jgi:hypothetical protein
LIIRLTDDPQAHVPALTARGLTVRHTYALTSSLAIEGSASASLALANEAWVVSIEEDKTVHTM